MTPTPPAPDGTLAVHTSPTLAIRPGRMWTGIAAREGTDCLNATVAGLSDGRHGIEITDVDDHVAIAAYLDRVIEAVAHCWHTLPAHAEWRVVVTATNAARRGRRKGEMSLAQWVIQREVAAAVRGLALPGLVLVELPARLRLGARHTTGKGGTGDPTAYYPSTLTGRRPGEWWASDHPKRDRQAEQAAYDLAAVLDTGWGRALTDSEPLIA